MVVERRVPGCTGFILSWLASALSLWIAAELIDGIHLETFFPDAIVAVLVLGFLNAWVRPVLVLLTLPVTFLTLGIFLIVINGAMLGAAGWLLDGLDVDGLFAAVLGAIVMGLTSSVFSRLLGPRDARPRADGDRPD